jgi:hypothetical protein
LKFSQVGIFMRMKINCFFSWWKAFRSTRLVAIFLLLWLLWIVEISKLSMMEDRGMALERQW